MSSLNSVTVVGRLGADPETRFTESGKTISTFNIALDGQGRDAEPVWIQIETWDRDAQLVADYVRKGHSIGIIGRLKQDRWTDKTSGQQRSKLLIVANRVQLFTTKAEAEAMAGGQGRAPRAAEKAAAVDATGWNAGPLSEEEVPF